MISADEGGGGGEEGSRYKLPGPGVPEGGPGPDYDFVPLGSIIIGRM